MATAMPLRKFLLIYLLTGLIFAVTSPVRAQQPGKAGQFDYYLFVLSWSPEFCHAERNRSNPECTEHRGFVVHGLWPQYNDGSYPVECPTDNAAPTDTSAVSGIMPAELIPHEWEKHGTCTGLSGDGYLATIRTVFNSVTVPNAFKAPSQSFTESPSDLRKQFEQANPKLSDGAIAVELSHGYLSAVEICFSKASTPAPIACSNVNGASGGTFKIAPVR